MTEDTNNTPAQDTPSAVPEETNKSVEPPSQSTPVESAKPVDPSPSAASIPVSAAAPTLLEPQDAPAPSTDPPSSAPIPPHTTSTATPPDPAIPIPDPPTSSAPAPPTSSQPKPKSKPRRARPRRRGAGDSDSEDEAAHSDNSLTSASGSDSGDSDEEEDASSKPSKPNGEKGKQPAAFPDSLSTTPAAWADEKLDGEEVAFTDFNNGDSKKPTKKPADGEKRVYTEEQTKRFEERKARMKEKQKARRAELKEAKRREREGAGKNEPKSNVEELVASTSALALDDPTSQRGVELLPSSGAPRNQRSDPKVTPRAGGFWTHDQRQDVEQEQHDFGRGRGRGFRGGLRGRGRGGPAFRGGFAMGGGRGQELTVDEPRGKKMSGEEGELEMDKLWAEMEAKDKARAERVEREAQEAEQRAEAKRVEEAEKEATLDAANGAEGAVVRPKANGSAKKDMWGHEGFESMTAVDQFQANRGPIRGRGRGRGAFGPVPPRGFAHPFRGRVHPGFRPPFAAPTGPRVTQPPQPAPPAPPPTDRRSPVKSSEATITQAGVDDLLAPPSQSVTVRLPGGVEQVVEAPKSDVIYSSPPAPSQPSPAPLLNGAAEFVPARTPIPEFIPSANPSPVPIAVQQFTGSDHGSMSSGGPTTAVPVPTPGYFPQGMVGPNGEYFNGEYQRQFYPQRYGHQQVPSGQFYPQSFSPDHFAANGQTHAQHPSIGSRASFPSPGQYYQDGRASPYFAPSPMGQPNGFFVPPRSSKVSIRAPVEETEESKAERAAFRQRIQQGQGSQAYSGAYNPYASVNGNGYSNGVPNGEGMMNGGNGEAVYYNQWQGQGGPYVQGGGGYEYTEYGY